MAKTYVLENEQLKVIAVDLAASIYQIYLKDQGKLIPMLSTPKTLDMFIDNDMKYGRTVGRTAGRVYADEKTSEFIDFKGEPYYMHGGPDNFTKKTFHITKHTADRIEFELTSNHKSDGYVGNLNVKITYRLFLGNLFVRHQAKTDQDTPVNLTFHPYFNLEASNTLKNHQFKVVSNTFLTRNETGRFSIQNKVAGTTKDYQDFKPLMIIENHALDDIFELPKDRYAATLKTNQVEMNIFTNYPTLVAFTQNKPTPTDLNNAKQGEVSTGIALEGQKSQKDLNILKSDRVYDHYIMYQFKQKEGKGQS